MPIFTNPVILECDTPDCSNSEVASMIVSQGKTIIVFTKNENCEREQWDIVIPERMIIHSMDGQNISPLKVSVYCPECKETRNIQSKKIQ